MKQYATYLRVSTQKQGARGLGMAAQRDMCDGFIRQNGGTCVREFSDVESGTHRDRRGLWQAIDYCKTNGYSLVIAKLDRLARDVEFTFRVINTGIDIHFADMPVVNSMILGVFASVAQYEREMCSKRTRDALAVKRAAGCKLGAASEAYKQTRDAKTEEEKNTENMERGKNKNMRHLQSKDVKAFAKILRNVYEGACKGAASSWDFSKIDTKRENRKQVLALMQDYKSIDPTLFRAWNFDDADVKLQRKLACTIANLKHSICKAKEYGNEFEI